MPFGDLLRMRLHRASQVLQREGAFYILRLAENMCSSTLTALPWTIGAELLLQEAVRENGAAGHL
jgi:hypothetical protein